MTENKKGLKSNEADKALKSFLNDLILKPIEQKLSDYIPKLKKEVNESVTESVDDKLNNLNELPDRIGEFEKGDDTIAMLLERLDKKDIPDKGELEKELNLVKSHLNTSIEENIKSVNKKLVPDNVKIENDIYTEIRELKGVIEKFEDNATKSKELINELISEKKNLTMFFITMLALQGIMLFYMIKLM